MSGQPDTDYLRPTSPIDLSAKSPLELLKQTCQNVGKDMGERRRSRRVKSLSPRQMWKKAQGSQGSPSSVESGPIASPPKAALPQHAPHFSPPYNMASATLPGLPLEATHLREPQLPQMNLLSPDYQVLYSQLLCQLELQKLKTQALMSGVTPSPFSQNTFCDPRLPPLPELPRAYNPFQLPSVNSPDFDSLDQYRNLLLVNPLLHSKNGDDFLLQNQHECHWVSADSYCGRKFSSHTELMAHLSEHVHANQTGTKNDLIRNSVGTNFCKVQQQDFNPFNLHANRFSPYGVHGRPLSMRQ